MSDTNSAITIFLSITLINLCIFCIITIVYLIKELGGFDMGKALIIGAGGVASVVIHKCCQNPEVFEEICIASRTLSKCEAIKKKLDGGRTKIQTAQLDADNTDMIIDLIKSFGPDIVINVALPYQDLTIMDACLATGVNYVDTANYEPPEIAKFEYKWQWAYKERFEKAGITALLGSGFDPGVTGVFCAYAQKHYFDEINYIDILDANAGDHGYPFATNFNPEINQNLNTKVMYNLPFLYYNPYNIQSLQSG